MSAWSTAALVLAMLSLSAVVSIIIGAMASLTSGRPGEEAMSAAGHRAVCWVSVLCGVGVLTLLALERLAP